MIVTFGSINLDLIFPLPHLPVAGETVLGPTMRVEPGGKGANQAVAAARDGAKVIFVGAVGRDALAEDALRLMRAAGIDLSRVARAGQATGCAAICVDAQGRNLIAVASGANLAARAAQVDDALLGPETTLLLQMEVPAVETSALIARAKSRGARVILNLAPAGILPRDALRALDVLIANEDEAAWLAAELDVSPDPPALSAALATTVVVTLGGEGVASAGPHGDISYPAHDITPVDTTAAGDCFAGVLAAALDRGLPLPDALRRANVAAGLACTRAGSQGSLPTAAETDAALAAS
jgi:ribokinase